MKTNTRMIATLGASALLVGGAAIGIASASDRDAAADARIAAAGAAKAGKALARHDGPAAIAAAEDAVAMAPADAGYRVLLGQSYLAAGRFVSARGAFTDALSLAPADAALLGKAALDLVLAQIATGDWAGARRTIDEHGTGIAPADRGLALALAGDPAGAVQLLTQAARSAETSPKVRQNLALSLALAGQWSAARAVAAVDVSPADLDARLEQWAAFARPHAAADQVATLLGVTPVEDAGQPARLALAGSGPATAVAAVSSPIPPVAQSAPEALAVAAPAVQPTAVAANRVSFGPRVEVVQPLPTGRPAAEARLLRAGSAPIKVALAGPKAAATDAAAKPGVTKGSWFVQLGAYQSAAVARDAWGRATHRLPSLAARGPSGMSFTIRQTTYYRLSVGGFARPQADATCRRFKSLGGDCFVRSGAGDQVAAWAHKGVQVASR